MKLDKHLELWFSVHLPKHSINKVSTFMSIMLTFLVFMWFDP